MYATLHPTFWPPPVWPATGQSTPKCAFLPTLRCNDLFQKTGSSSDCSVTDDEDRCLKKSIQGYDIARLTSK